MSLGLGYYGKLPEYGDFIKSSSSTDAIVEYRMWLDASFKYLTSKLNDNFSETYKDLPIIGTVIRPPESPRAMVGICIPSRDQSGRQFPFSVYAEVADGLYGQQFHLVPEAYKLFLSFGRKQLMESVSTESVFQERNIEWGLREGIPVGTLSGQVDFANYLEKVSLHDFIRSFDEENKADFGLRMLKSFLIAVVPARESYSEKFRAIFRFAQPKVSSPGGLAQALLIRLCETILGAGLSGQTLFWTDKYFDIAFGVPGHRMLANSWIIDRDDDNIWDFSMMNLDDSSVDKQFGSEVDSILSNEDSSLSRFLDDVNELISKVNKGHVRY